jgi:hypothetical protein
MADHDSELIERALDISKACLLPELLHNFDSKAIAGEDFKEFCIMANEQLHFLLDILYQNRHLLTNQAYDNQLIQLRANLILIACEQLANNPYIKSEDKMLMTSLEKIFYDHFEQFEDVIYKSVIARFKEALNKQNWKKNIGLLFGFSTFCKILFQFKRHLVDSDKILFALSVGSNLVLHYDPMYKTIGLKVYCHIMELSSQQILTESNISSVIYTDTLPLIQRSSEFDYNNYLYRCLYQAIQLIEGTKITNSRWCKYDDLMSKLITHFSIETNNQVCKLLIYNIIKFCGINNSLYNMKSYDDFTLMAKDEHCEKYFFELKSTFNQPNHRTSRWIKKLMEMQVRESAKMLSSEEDGKFFIFSFHSIYIMTIFTMESSGFHHTLIEFTKKMIIILMRVIKRFERDVRILESVLSFLATIEQHQHDNVDLINSLNKIREHEILRVE